MHADASGRLAKHMPHELKYTRRVRATRPTKATNIANRTSVHERPQEADGTRFGDWEMDTIVDSYGHAIVTLTERSTNFVLMEKRVSRNLVGINFRHPNVMPNFAVWKTITYRHWHRWCCQPRF